MTIVPEPETPAQIPETTQDPEARDQPLTLLPAVSGVSPEDVKSVVDAYLSWLLRIAVPKTGRRQSFMKPYRHLMDD